MFSLHRGFPMKSAITLLSMATLLVASGSIGSAAEPLAPVTQRFTGAPEETPDFQRHLVPLLGKLGCNGRACHGSFQGQGGFQLSLFGYDFKMDHAGLSDRVATDDPAASYALEKATLVTEHEGGKRMEPGSWEYNLFMNWIAGGAQPVTEDAPKLVRLHVTPAEILFESDGEQAQLKAVAEWSDGTLEDVTPLCRFQSNDTQIVTVTVDGLVSAGEPGDSHVVAFYDNAVVPIQVIRPVSDQTGAKYPQIAASTPVDALVLEKLSKLGIIPSERADDAQFLRRVSLDLAGTLPTSEEVREFVADTSVDKRSAKIDELLETPAYAAWWATKLCDFTGNSDEQLVNVRPNNVASREWYDWIHKRVADNMPYDELVAGMVLGRSRQEGEDYREYSARQSEWFHNGSENQFAQEPTLPHFWARRNFRMPEDRVVAFAHAFLGIRIQCAQCHKHPFDQWTQDDFANFQGFFASTTFAQNGADRRTYQEMVDELGVESKRAGDLRRELVNLLRDGKTVPFPEVVTRPAGGNERGRRQGRRRNAERVDEARLLGGEPINLAALEDPREPLMDWLRSQENPLFARAFVNRVWAAYFNRGIVEPTDDLSLANPPSNEALLDYLARGFVESGYDMKWVHRAIANSDTYQRSWQPNETNEYDERNFSRAIPRRIPAEVAYDAIQMATLSDERTQSYLHDLTDRAIAMPGVPRGAARYRGEFYALSVFGKSARENNCDCERSAEPSLLQTIYLRNDDDLLSQIDRPREGWLREITRDAGLTFNARSAGPERPANYEATITRLERQIKQFRKREASPEAIKRAEQRLREYRRQYDNDGAEQRSSEGKDDQSLARDTALKIIEEAYLRTLSRLPTEQEQQVAVTYLDEADQPVDGLRDLVWSLLNTKEFIVNH
jgi:hypothetical protein